MKFKIALRPNVALVRHQSHAYNKLIQKQTVLRENQLEEVVEWCQQNDCKGYKALKSGMFPLIRDARTINRRLLPSSQLPVGVGQIITGQEKAYSKGLRETGI